jgi:hypothetical protein
MSLEAGLEQFAADLRQESLARMETEAGDEGVFHEAMFVRVMLDYLSDAGETEDAQVCLHRATGIQVSGYAISENEESLDLFVAIHTNCVPPETVLQAKATAAFKRVTEFFSKARYGYFQEIEESGEVFDLAQIIARIAKTTLLQVRFILITDGVVKNPPPVHKEQQDFRANFEIWDIARLHRFVSSGRQREAIEFDFEQALGEPIPCLAQPYSSADYAAYLAIFPAVALVEIYGKYGSRLLERNVRSFLQARGKVNVGMRDTIRKTPEMFLAFNNGLSVTAEAVTLVDCPNGGKGIKSVRDFQIVNGGQTTASIYHAFKRDKADISRLSIQVKLTVLNDASKMDTIIPLISLYANSQNKIQEADLSANHPYHRELEELSRTVWAPAKYGTMRQTKWFYERSRSQYKDERLRAGTPAKVKQFDAEYPKDQLVVKTDIAKALVSWHLQPHLVSKGAQACFSAFMSSLEEIEKAEGKMDTQGYHRLIAKVILFRSAERLIKNKAMGFTGYWANLVTYTVARLVHETGGMLDLERIWKEQKLSANLEGAIQEIAQSFWSHLLQSSGQGNVTQFCKQEICWKGFLQRPVYISDAVKTELISSQGRGAVAGIASRKQAETVQRRNLLAAITPEQWMHLHTWSEANGKLNGLYRSYIIGFATRDMDKPLTASQMKKMEEVLALLKDSGISVGEQVL